MRAPPLPLPRPLLLVALLIAAACGGTADSAPRVQLLDSAGVPVVVNAAPDSTTLPRWHLPAAPTVEIGVVDGPAEYQIFRAGSGTLLANGGVVVANGGTNELRFYDQAGRHLYSIGREGSGPGEFTGLSLLGSFAGDSLLVWDLRQRRLSVFTVGGAFARSYGAPADLGIAPTHGGVTADGRMVAVVREIAVMGPGGGENRVERRSERIVVAAPDGSGAAPLGEFPGTEMSIYDLFSMGVLFGRRLHFHARGDVVAIGNDDAYSVRLYTPDGALTRIVRLDRPAEPVQPGDHERMPAPPPTSPLRDRMEGAIRQMPRHTTFPAYEALRLDGSGRLWVQEYRKLWEETTAWQVFAPDGTLLARLELPAGVDYLDANGDRLLVRTRDDMDVERLRVYRLEGDGAGG